MLASWLIVLCWMVSLPQIKSAEINRKNPFAEFKVILHVAKRLFLYILVRFIIYVENTLYRLHLEKGTAQGPRIS